MRITFLAHSGFLVELEGVLLLFDWWKGALPPLTEGKPLLVFASHSHPDHFNPEIFKLDDGSRDIQFLLGKDIRFSPKRRQLWNVSPELEEKCTRLGGQRTLEPLSGVQVETFTSTDAGVAFLVCAQGQTIYHAGDLNWWYWAGESESWNRDMEHNYKTYLAPMKGRHVDLAMVPLDPRLEEGEDYGLRYFLEITDTDFVLPMHQWEDYSPTHRFLAHYPQWREKILPVRQEGQCFTLPLAKEENQNG